MLEDMLAAQTLLKEKGYTCVAVGDGQCRTSTQRGVKPLLDWIDAGVSLKGCCVADKVVGKASAMLYVLLEAREVFALVISDSACEVLERYGIPAAWDTRVARIRNRTNTGFCPMEEATQGIDEPLAAMEAVRKKVEQLRGQQSPVLEEKGRNQMIYKEFQGLKLSALGLGCMRFPLKDGKIDEEATAQMVAYAMEQGINYYDTAWGYHEGCSEPVMGKLLAKYPRDSFYLATKFPGYEPANLARAAEIFEQQLERCQVDYFDFYLLHTVSERNIDDYLDPKYGLIDYLLEQKAKGRIRHLGFSVHASNETTRRFLDACGQHMEFCQVQLNWLDWSYQQAEEKVELLRERNIPVWVMEPVRGGKLATLQEKYESRLKPLRPEESMPGWAFRFLQSVEGVTVTLSGMSNFQQLQENICTFSEEKPLNQQEMDVLLGIARDMTSQQSVPCTACRYCIERCPQELDIPFLLELYNQTVCEKGLAFVSPKALEALPEGKRPADCVGCRGCEEACPQQIPISEVLKDFASRVK